jgi:hypothetical protein
MASMSGIERCSKQLTSVPFAFAQDTGVAFTFIPVSVVATCLQIDAHRRHAGGGKCRMAVTL